jgi:hypothetical protein
MTAGDIYKIAGNHTRGDTGNGGPAAKAEITQPSYLAVDPAGNVLFSGGLDLIRMVAGTTGTSYGQTVTAGDIYQVAGPDAPTYAFNPYGLAENSAGDLFYVNSGRSLVQEISG